MVVVTVRVSTTAVAVPVIPAYTGEGHNKECYCGSTSRYSGSVLWQVLWMLTLVAGVLIVVAARLEVAFVVVRG